jgi:hypothetical protein
MHENLFTLMHKYPLSYCNGLRDSVDWSLLTFRCCCSVSAALPWHFLQPATTITDTPDPPLTVLTSLSCPHKHSSDVDETD